MSIYYSILLFAAQQAFGNAEDSLPWGGYKNFTIQQGSYVFHNDRVTWETAKERCAGAGAGLWVPADGGEQLAVWGEVKECSQSWAIWTGINDLNNTGTLKSPNDRPLSTDQYKWGKGEPHPDRVALRCVALGGSSPLYLLGCEIPRPYVCKLPPAPASA